MEKGDEPQYMCEALDIIENRGIQKGISQGISQGLHMGEEKQAKATALRMLADDMPLETVAKYVGLDIDIIKKWWDERKEIENDSKSRFRN